ncbi:MAG: response regulator, partial [Desulfovibrio sp.]
MAGPSKPSRIVVVDDTPEDLSYLGYLLQKHGHSVLSFVDGLEALQAAQADLPDLFILDIALSDEDGIGLSQQIQGNEGLRNIPVIFSCGLTRTGDKAKALQSGGADYITKPYSSAEVEARVSAQLKLRHRELELAEEARCRMAAEQALAEAQTEFEAKLEQTMDRLVSERLEQAVDLRVQERLAGEVEAELARRDQGLAGRVEELTRALADKDTAARGLQESLDEMAASKNQLDK